MEDDAFETRAFAEAMAEAGWMTVGVASLIVFLCCMAAGLLALR